MSRKLAIGLMILLSTHAAAQVTASIGKSSWLFLDEEQPLRHNEMDSDIYNSLYLIARVNTFLKSKNIKLVVVPVPIKSRVYSEYLVDGLGSSSESRYNRAIKYFQEADISYVNIDAAMMKAKSILPEKKLFFKLGSHWNSWGSEISARSVARNLLEMNFLRDTGIVNVNMQRNNAIESTDSMINMLRDSSSFTNYKEFDTPTEISVSRGGQLLDDISPAVVLVGTSYSEKTWGFPGFLSYYTKRDILDFSISGQQIWVPIEKYLKSEVFAKYHPKLIIWEIPERNLLYPPLGYRSQDKSWMQDFLKVK